MSANERQLNSLAEEVLAAYSVAVRLRELEAAEHLLRALETLAERSAGCEDCRDEAYLALARRGSWSVGL